MTARGRAGNLLLLFARGRPDVAVMKRVASETEQLSVTSVLESGDANATCGVELLRDGMTFDLLGALPGPSFPVPPLVHRLGVPRDLDESSAEALSLHCGPHLDQGAHTVPVIRTMMGVATMLVPHLPGLTALAWGPARTLIGPDFFVSSMSAWLAGGAFPALGLTAFTPEPDGSLVSEGLAFFTGQEVRLRPDVANDRAAGARLGIRLVNQLVGQSKVGAAETIVGPSGERLRLAPSADGLTVVVQRG